MYLIFLWTDLVWDVNFVLHAHYLGATVATYCHLIFVPFVHAWLSILTVIFKNVWTCNFGCNTKGTDFFCWKSFLKFDWRQWRNFLINVIVLQFQTCSTKIYWILWTIWCKFLFASLHEIWLGHIFLLVVYFVFLIILGATVAAYCHLIFVGTWLSIWTVRVKNFWDCNLWYDGLDVHLT